MDKRGLFIVIEGSDGSGKATQLNLLKERLKAMGYDVAEFDFPRYDKESSYFVRQYLAGEFGAATKISPYTSSLFYALDRYEASHDIKKALKQGKIVLSNRYVGSNMAHQGAKFDDPVEQRGFFIWEDNLEFELLGIPRPSLSFFLRVPAEVSLKLVKQRAAKAGKKLDGHESNSAFLKRSLETYDVLCRLFPKDFRAIDCAKAGQLLSVAEINNLIWKNLKPLLPAERHHPSHSVVVKLGEAPKVAAGPVEAPASELRHLFKDVSLLLRLLLERQDKVTVTPAFRGWARSDYSYYTPQGLPRNLADTYHSTMERLVNNHKQIADKLSRYFSTDPKISQRDIPALVEELLIPLTPLCALVSFELAVRKEAVKALTESLLTNDGDEAQWTSQQLFLAARQKWASDFEAPLEADNLSSINSIINKFPADRLVKLGAGDETVSLAEVNPKLEFDLLAESLYSFTDLPLEDITEEVSNWPYSQKYKGLKETAARSSSLKQVRYKLDILSDQVLLDKLIGLTQPSAFRLQSFTARYGFDTPEIIEQAGVDDLYADCFDESLKLFSLLQGAGLERSAAYATLLGHKIRWQISIDAESLRRASEQADEQLKGLVEALIDKVSEAHPLLWDILKGLPMEAKMPKNRIKPAHRPVSRRGRGKRR